jgi:transcriptional regulator with XRE-family HTH domain
MDVFLTPPLVKAARALLEWHQRDLARAAGLSMTAINNFERGIGKTRIGTSAAIKDALEVGGIEFLSSGGLRKTEDIAQITRYSGDDFIVRWNKDIFTAVHDRKEEILVSSADEGHWYHPSVRPSNIQYLAWLKQRDIIQRSLVPDGHKTLNLPKRFYRTLPQQMIGKIAYCIYGDRLAFVLWKNRQVVVLRNALVVATFRHQFDYLWRIAKPL